MIHHDEFDDELENVCINFEAQNLVEARRIIQNVITHVQGVGRLWNTDNSKQNNQL